MHRLPSDILTHIYEFDPTFHHLYHGIVHRDITVYVFHGMFHYVPQGVHAFIFFPKYWAIETDVDVHQQQDDHRKVRILRFFLDKHEFLHYQKSIVSKSMESVDATPSVHSVDWKDVESFMLESFVWFST